jgi:hypothetical protein
MLTKESGIVGLLFHSRMAKYDFIVSLGTETKTLVYFPVCLKRKRTQEETIFKFVYIGNATL